MSAGFNRADSPKTLSWTRVTETRQLMDEQLSNDNGEVVVFLEHPSTGEVFAMTNEIPIWTCIYAPRFSRARSPESQPLFTVRRQR